MAWWEALFPSPPVCLCCENTYVYSRISHLCNSCLSELSFRRRPAVKPETLSDGDSPFHTLTSDHYQPSPVEIISPLNYRGLARRLIRDLKYRGLMEAALPLSELMSAVWRNTAGDFSFSGLLLPVPLSSQRQRERGFNQAAFLTVLVGEDLGLHFREDILLRRRETPALFDLTPAQRREVLSGAFRLRPGTEMFLGGQRIILIDDIVTTGSTLREAAGLLKARGALEVRALTAAAAAVREDNGFFSRTL